MAEKKIKIPGNLQRSVGEITLDTEKKTLTFPFSSEIPYERYFGFEILSHQKDAVDLSRLNSKAPLLFNHDTNRVIGVVEKAWIEDNRGFCTVRFSSNADAQAILKDIEDGIINGVSVGYQINEIELTKESKDGPSTYTVTKWMAYEVSIAPVPADFSVGIGRSNENTNEVEIFVKCTESNINNEQATTAEKTKGLSMSEKENAVLAERERVAKINLLGDQFAKADMARQLIEKGASLDEAKDAFLKEAGLKIKSIAKPEDAKIGLSQKEIGNYSFVKAFNYLANPNDKDAFDAASFERELSIEAAKRSGRKAQGLIVPSEILLSKRDLNVGTATAGGNLVSTDLMSGSFIDLLRNKSIVQQLGATILDGLVGDIAIPRCSGGVTAYWLAENGAPTESQPTIDQVAMKPKTVGAYTDISRKLLKQGSLSVENFVRSELAKALALEIDRAALYGTGADNQPKGLKNITGINTLDLAAAAPTWAEIVEMETKVAADNADIGSLAYLMGATGRGALKSAVKAANTAAFIFENNMVNGYKAEVSNQVVDGDFFFGNFADLIIAFWSGVDLIVDPYSNSTMGIVRICAHQDVDVNARHAESFCRAANTL